MRVAVTALSGVALVLMAISLMTFSRLSSLEMAVETHQSDLDSLNSSARKRQSSIAALGRRVAMLEARLDSLVADLARLKDEAPKPSEETSPLSITEPLIAPGVELPQYIYTFDDLPDADRRAVQASWDETPGCMKEHVWYSTNQGYYYTTFTRPTDDPGALLAAGERMIAMAKRDGRERAYILRRRIAGEFTEFAAYEEALSHGRSLGKGMFHLAKRDKHRPADENNAWLVFDLREFRESAEYVRLTAQIDMLGDELKKVYGTGMLGGGPVRY
ncbi:MAG: hypothetical protein ACE5GW_02830 [Planctomycetota bacterium]